MQLSEGYILDYEQVQEGEVVTRIRPFARKKGEEEGEPPLLDFLSPDMEGLTDQDVENLYQFLIYEKTPRGLFGYAFFVLELWSTRASWHEAEWLASTPVFTQQHFEEVRSARNKCQKLQRRIGIGERSVKIEKS